MIHTVKGFGIVSKTEIDVFLELSYFFDDPAEAGSLISGSSAFSKISLNIWKFTFHVLLKSWIMRPKQPLFWPHSPFGTKEDKQLDSELWGSPLSSFLFQGCPFTLPASSETKCPPVSKLSTPAKTKKFHIPCSEKPGSLHLMSFFLIYFIESVLAIRQAGVQALCMSVSEHGKVSHHRAEKAQVQRLKALRDYTA